MANEAKHTPITDSLVKEHSVQTARFLGDKEGRKYLAVRQVKALLEHARKMESDRAELMAALEAIIPFLDKQRFGRDDEMYDRKRLAIQARAALASARGE